MLKFKVWTMQRFYRVGLWWWKWWSMLYRWLYHRKYSKTLLTGDLTPAEIQGDLDLVTWTKDGTRELWDSCGSPHWVQYVIDDIKAGKPQPKGALDCDDFTSWACAVVDENYEPRVFSFTWVGQTFDEDGTSKHKIQGHAMCLLKQKESDQLFHIGNWGLSTSGSDLQKLCVDIMTRANASLAIGWALMDTKLNVLEYGTKLPDKGIK